MSSYYGKLVGLSAAEIATLTRGGMSFESRRQSRRSLDGITILEIGDQIGDYGRDAAGRPWRRSHQARAARGLAVAAALVRSHPTARDPEQSIFFWRYNLNKKSAVLDVDAADASAALAALAAKADIVLLSGEFDTVERRLELWRKLAEENPRLIVCTITPFGLDGPYREFKSTDLAQMALGGIMAVCGYDPDEDGAMTRRRSRPRCGIRIISAASMRRSR